MPLRVLKPLQRLKGTLLRTVLLSKQLQKSDNNMEVRKITNNSLSCSLCVSAAAGAEAYISSPAASSIGVKSQWCLQVLEANTKAEQESRGSINLQGFLVGRPCRHCHCSLHVNSSQVHMRRELAHVSACVTLRDIMAKIAWPKHIFCKHRIRDYMVGAACRQCLD